MDVDDWTAAPCFAELRTLNRALDKTALLVGENNDSYFPQPSCRILRRSCVLHHCVRGRVARKYLCRENKTGKKG
jgi:hypothetical protein